MCSSLISFAFSGLAQGADVHRAAAVRGEEQGEKCLELSTQSPHHPPAEGIIIKERMTLWLENELVGLTNPNTISKKAEATPFSATCFLLGTKMLPPKTSSLSTVSITIWKWLLHKNWNRIVYRYNPYYYYYYFFSREFVRLIKCMNEGQSVFYTQKSMGKYVNKSSKNFQKPLAALVNMCKFLFVLKVWKSWPYHLTQSDRHFLENCVYFSLHFE